MNIKINKGRAVGEIKAPPSKSMAHRLLICGALSEGKTVVRDISSCEDVLATLDCLASLGIKCERCGNDVTVWGKRPDDIEPEAPLYCRESGSTLRFMIPIAMRGKGTSVFYGDRGLIDDARTPLIIAGPVPRKTDQMFEEYRPLVERLVEAQKKLATKYLAEARRKIYSSNSEEVTEGYLSLFRSHKALPKNKALIKLLSEPGVKSGMLKT